MSMSDSTPGFFVNCNLPKVEKMKTHSLFIQFFFQLFYSSGIQPKHKRLKHHSLLIK